MILTILSDTEKPYQYQIAPLLRMKIMTLEISKEEYLQIHIKEQQCQLKLTLVRDREKH